MKRIFLAILPGLFLLVLVFFFYYYPKLTLGKKDIGNDYFIKNNKVYFIDDYIFKGGYYHDDYIPLLKEVEGANAGSFKKLNGSSNVFKDEKNIFCRGIKISNVDPMSFKDISGCKYEEYFFDKNQVYTLSLRGWTPYDTHCEFEVMKNVDAKSFQCSHGIIFDKNNAYSNGKAYLNLSKNFRFLDSHYAVDDNNVYYIDTSRLRIIKDAKSDSFIKLGEGYFKDEFNVYYWGERLEQADAKTFIIVGHTGQDQNYTYFNGVPELKTN